MQLWPKSTTGSASSIGVDPGLSGGCDRPASLPRLPYYAVKYFLLHFLIVMQSNNTISWLRYYFVDLLILLWCIGNWAGCVAAIQIVNLLPLFWLQLHTTNMLPITHCEIVTTLYKRGRLDADATVSHPWAFYLHRGSASPPLPSMSND